MVRREAVGEARVAAVDRQGVLGQVVGADAEEVAHLGQPVGDDHRRRASRSSRRAAPLAAARTPAARERRAPPPPACSRVRVHLVDPRHQRQHELDVARRPRRGARAELGPEDLGWSRQTRIERQPRNGFASCGAWNAAGNLSPPRSKVRMTTGWPGNACATRRK